MWKDLGSSPMYANYVLFDLLLILILYMVMLGDNMIVKVCELAWWFSFDLALVWSWVQTLVSQI